MPPDTLGLYPLADLSGEPIPYEVIRPLGLAQMPFTDTVSAAISIPATAGLLAIWATNECLISIGGVAALPANGVFGAGLMVVPANQYINVDHNAATTLTVLGLREPGGTLFITYVDKWKGMHKPSQFSRN